MRAMRFLTRASVALGVGLGAIVLFAGLLAPSSQSSASLIRQRRTAQTATPTPDDSATPPAATTRNQGTVATPSEPSYKGFVQRVYIDAQGQEMTYYLHIPPLARSARYPVVLLLHGAGERAYTTSTPVQNRDRILNDPYVSHWTSLAVQSHWPSFIIVPQATNTNRWVNVLAKYGSYHLAPEPTPSLALAKDILDWTEQEYSNAIDRSRIYVTGISMGGFGAWDAIERWPQAFSAAAPVSGAGDPSYASRLVNLPIWVFHGALDTTAPVSGSRQMVAAITAAGGHPRYTEYPDAHHDIWMRVYSSNAFLSWLFAQRSPT